MKDGNIPPLFVLPDGKPVVVLPNKHGVPKVIDLSFLDELFSMDIEESRRKASILQILQSEGRSYHL